MMRQKASMAFLCLLVFASGRLEGGEGSLEPPMIPLRLLAGSLIEKCSICAESDTKKAFAMLDKEYPPAAVFASTPDCAFVKTIECGRGEFLLSCYSAREPYDGSGDGKGAFPLLVFRFHTKSEHLVGVDPGDFTAADIALKVAEARRDRPFDASIRVIAYRYGDGAAFNYSAKKNRLTVHCRVMRFAPRR